ncbi:GATA zinc finger domain-containing protein 14-like [Plodia interpunctella]|uniref:GATA zinc finger domain-containing protein 14-like n=1 Tax=Plodia interpunctella TaxID=58824 RepID=UPI0023684623|nr:GATA zinc finger domain-containing protein 14-like [Plodia interpunctella]
MKMKNEENVIKDEDDDVVILGDFIPKPMISHIKKRRKRHVDLRKSTSVDGSLVITQKVKVKKRKHRCILNVKKKHLQQNDSIKKRKEHVKVSFEDIKKVKNSYERITPLCLRPTCIDIRCKIKRNIEKGIQKRRLKLHHGFPRDLKRLLSPISPNSMGNEMSRSKDCLTEISLDTSSFDDEKESKLDILIKRTRERDRINEVARTRLLCTPPQTDTAKEIIEDRTCTDYKAPCTSTPKYEENINDNKNRSITNTKSEELKIKDNSFFKEIQAAISPIKSLGDMVAVTNIKDEQSMNIPQDGYTKQSNVDGNIYSESIKNKHETSPSKTNYGDSMSISDCDNLTEQPNLLLEDTHVDQKHTIYTNNVLSNTSLVQNFDKINILSLNGITNQLSLDHSSVSNLMQNKHSEHIHTPFSNKNCDAEDNGQSITQKNYSVSQNLTLEHIPVLVSTHKYDEYIHNVESNRNEQNDEKIITKQLSLDHNLFCNQLVQNKNSEYIHTTLSANNFKQNFENNGQPVSHKNFSFAQNPNLDQILVSEDTHIHNKYVECLDNAASSTNLEDNNDKIDIYNFHNDITKQISLDHNSFSKELVQNNESEYIHSSFSSKYCDQNVEEYGTSILDNNYVFSQRRDQDLILPKKFIQYDKTEYISNENCDQILENKRTSYNNYNFSRGQNEQYIPLSDEVVQNEKSRYMHTAFFNNDPDHDIDDKDKSNRYNDTFFHDPNEDRMTFANERNNNQRYLPKDFCNIENNKFTKLDDDPFLDESRVYGESEYINTEHEMKSTYHYNSNRCRHSSRNRNPFFEDIIQHRKYEYAYREYESMLDNKPQNRSSRDKFNNQFYGEEHVMNDKYVRKRRSVSSGKYELVPRDQWVRNGHKNNNDEQSNRNHKSIFDNNIKRKKSGFIYRDHTYRHRDSDQEFEVMPLAYNNNISEQQNRNHNEFEDTNQNRHDDYDGNGENINISNSNNTGFRRKVRRNHSPFIDDLPTIKSEQSEFYTNSAKNRYNSHSNFFTKQPNKDRSPQSEDIRIKHKHKQIKNNINFVQDMRMSTPYNFSNKNKQPKNKFNQANWEHRSIFEEIHFRYKKSDYTNKHTVYSSHKYEHNSKRYKYFDNNQGDNDKPFSGNTPDQYKTSKYVHTVSSRRYKKVVYKRETYM